MKKFNRRNVVVFFLILIDIFLILFTKKPEISSVGGFVLVAMVVFEVGSIIAKIEKILLKFYQYFRGNKTEGWKLLLTTLSWVIVIFSLSIFAWWKTVEYVVPLIDNSNIAHAIYGMIAFLTLFFFIGTSRISIKDCFLLIAHNPKLDIDEKK